MGREVVIVNYSAGNIFSVETALRRLGVEAVVSADPAVIEAAGKVIIPGVGNSGIAMESLRVSQLAGLLTRLSQPVLGICLGMQLMYEWLDESDEAGLGIIPGRVSRFTVEELPVPHMAWNRIYNLKGPLFSGVKEGEWVYFVHSYMAAAGDETIATCSYGVPFTAAAGRDNFYGCQFHPEKSGEAGQRIINNFIEL